MTNAQRQKAYRERKRNDSAPSVTNPAESVTKQAPNVTKNPPEAHETRENTRIASLEDYLANGKDYALRACAELLNWGPWMSASELSAARLSGNRQTIVGDWDYEHN